MGNNQNNVRKAPEDPSQKSLDEIFNVISNRKSYILRSDLRNTWSSQIDRDLYAIIEGYLFKRGQNDLSSQSFKRFYQDMCKGDADQKIAVIFDLLEGKNKIPGWKLFKFITNILNSIIIIQQAKSPKRYNSWKSRMTSTSDSIESVDTFSNYFLTPTQKTLNDDFTEQDLRTILIQLDFFIQMIISRLYETEDKHFYSNLLPKWKESPDYADMNLEDFSVMDLYRVIFLNYELPFDFQHVWRILFSTSIHGESFSKLSAEIIHKGATVIIIKDKDDYIFGGFASTSWSLSPTFHGDNRSFLFTIYPKMSVYPATNFNEHYQYINFGQQTMPNGLGMGGRLEYFGMWIDAEFGKGYCSESCTTFRNYKMLSRTKEFQIAHLEVWGVGPPPPPTTETQKSVLDGNEEAKAMLELAGKANFSKRIKEDIEI